VLPNVHLRKHWQRNVRVWLNQAGRKSRRLQTRRARAVAVAPRPLDRLRPSVRCQTIRYNHRPRLGKGFTLAEIKSVGLGVEFAKSVGITVDHRRKNRSQEGFENNKARLTNYLSKLVLYPRHEAHYVTKAKTGLLNDTAKVFSTIFRISKQWPLLQLSIPSLLSSKEWDQWANWNWKDWENPTPTDLLDRSGTTKGMRVKDKRKLGKPLRRITDFDSYLIPHHRLSIKFIFWLLPFRIRIK
jgi:ribosomal protein L13E